MEQTIFDQLEQLKAENAELRHKSAKLEVDIENKNLRKRVEHAQRASTEEWLRFMKTKQEADALRGEVARLTKLTTELAVPTETAKSRNEMLEMLLKREPLVLMVIREAEAFRALPQGSGTTFFESLGRLSHACHMLAKHKFQKEGV